MTTQSGFYPHPPLAAHHPWEAVLLDWAHEAHGCAGFAEAEGDNQGLLEQAYAACEQVTAEHSRTFYLTSGLLPPDKRRAVRALYAFCRVSDDLVDRAPTAGRGDARGELERWRDLVLAPRRPQAPSGNPVAAAFAATRARYGISECLVQQFFAGVAHDLETRRYATFDELAQYSYGVASTVGLMVMQITGHAGPQALPYAVKLGVALQTTNILRDVAEDWQAGRLYLPENELADFGLAERDVAAGVAGRGATGVARAPGGARWQAFMRFQIERNRRLYAEAMPGIALLHPDGRFAIQAAAELYQAILSDIEAHRGDVFSRRAHVGAWGKLRRLPGIWLRSRAAQPARRGLQQAAG